MTDKEKVIALLNELGVGFREQDGVIECFEGMSKVGGYANFYVQFAFSDDGSFVEIGAYE